MRRTIGLTYTCNECGLKDVTVQIVARTTEDIVDWMQDVLIPKLAQDHWNRSPSCIATTLSQVKIPLAKNEGSPIGGVID